MSRFNRFFRRASRLVAVSTIGAVLVLAGVALSLPGVPGPGLVLVIAGLAVLAKEFEWARRLMRHAKARAERLRDRALGHATTAGADDPAGDGGSGGDGGAPKQRESSGDRNSRRHEPAA